MKIIFQTYLLNYSFPTNCIFLGNISNTIALKMNTANSYLGPDSESPGPFKYTFKLKTQIFSYINIPS